MDPDQERKHLVAQADRHIIEVKKHILRQRVLVQKAIKTGRPSAEAQSMLEALQASLRAFVKHRWQALRNGHSALFSRLGHTIIVLRKPRQLSATGRIGEAIGQHSAFLSATVPTLRACHG
jgi:hypothetical protein